MLLANEWRCDIVTSSLIGWMLTKNDPCFTTDVLFAASWYLDNDLSKIVYMDVLPIRPEGIHSSQIKRKIGISHLNDMLVFTHWGWDKMTIILQTIVCHSIHLSFRFGIDLILCILHNDMRFLMKNVWIFNMILLKYVPLGHYGNTSPLLQVRALCQTGEKPLSGPMMVSVSWRYNFIWKYIGVHFTSWMRIWWACWTCLHDFQPHLT